MDPETRRLLEEIHKLTEENNKLLHQVRSVQKWAAFWRVLKILVIVGIAFGAFYFMEPYLDKMMNLYNSVLGAEQKLNSGSNTIKDLLNKF